MRTNAYKVLPKSCFSDLFEMFEDSQIWDEDDDEGDEESEAHQVEGVRQVGVAVPRRAAAEIEVDCVV